MYRQLQYIYTVEIVVNQCYTYSIGIGMVLWQICINSLVRVYNFFDNTDHLFSNAKVSLFLLALNRSIAHICFRLLVKVSIDRLLPCKLLKKICRLPSKRK